MPIPRGTISKTTPHHYAAAVGNFIKALDRQGRAIPDVMGLKAVHGCTNCFTEEIGDNLRITRFHFRHTDTVFEMYTHNYVERDIGKSDLVGYGSYTIDREKGVADLGFQIFEFGLDEYGQRREGYRHKEYPRSRQPKS